MRKSPVNLPRSSVEKASRTGLWIMLAILLVVVIPCVTASARNTFIGIGGIDVHTHPRMVHFESE